MWKPLPNFVRVIIYQYLRYDNITKIIKGKIGNAITSVAEDHIVVVSEDVFDEKHQKYQSEINDIAIGGTKWEGE